MVLSSSVGQEGVFLLRFYVMGSQTVTKVITLTKRDAKVTFLYDMRIIH